MLLMGQTWFRQGEITKEATRESTDVISEINVNAKANTKTGTVTVKAAKGFRFGRTESALVAA